MKIKITISSNNKKIKILLEKQAKDNQFFLVHRMIEELKILLNNRL